MAKASDLALCPLLASCPSPSQPPWLLVPTRRDRAPRWTSMLPSLRFVVLGHFGSILSQSSSEFYTEVSLCGKQMEASSQDSPRKQWEAGPGVLRESLDVSLWPRGSPAPGLGDL